MKQLFTTAILLMIMLQAIAQEGGGLRGRIIDEKNEAAFGVTVAVLTPDSNLVTGKTTDIDGKFLIENLTAGDYLIKISYVGYQDIYSTEIYNGTSLDLGTINLKEKAITLGNVSVVGLTGPVQQKGDTTQISANSYKTNPDANAEDLITKMPGITVQDGKVQAQGEDVKKVTVDGKDYFGDDANAVLKNLPAEVIDKIQIFDKKSEQSEFSGFDDGNTTKTLNITTRPQFRDGVFGKFQAGYGYEDKWKGGFNVNFFKGDRRLTLLANTNNINEQNFSADDLLGVIGTSGGGGRGRGGSGGGGPRGGGGGRPGGQGGSDAGNFLVDQRNGITTSNMFGLNYANKWNKLEFTGSYFFNHAQNNALTSLSRQYITNENAGLTYNETNSSSSTNINHRVNLKFDWKIDSSNWLMFQPRFSLQQNEGTRSLQGTNAQTGEILSKTGSEYRSDLQGYNMSFPLNYRHAFAKKGRTVSLQANPGYKQNTGSSRLLSHTTNYSDTLFVDSLNQESRLEGNGFTMNTNLAYSEPLSKNSQLMVNYGTNYNRNESDKRTFNKLPNENAYNSLDTALSNTFESRYFAQNIGLNYRYQVPKWNMGVGLSYQYATLNAEQQFPVASTITRPFRSLLPNARFQYKFSNRKTLRIFYRSSNNAPSVSQLQNVIDNSNPLQLSMGNPNLKQDMQHNLTFRYNTSNVTSGSSFFTMLNMTYAQDYIVNSTLIANQDSLLSQGIILARGAQLNVPVNLDGYTNIRFFNNYGIPLRKIKSNFNVSLTTNYTRTPGLINTRVNYSNLYLGALGLVFSSNISEKVDFSLSSNSSYNHIVNSLRQNANNDYFNQSTRFKMQVNPWKGLIFQTDLNHQYFNGLTTGFNNNYLLWNAAIGYKFLPKRQAEVRLYVYDILKQNNSITRNITETYYEDVQSNVLQQYFMLSFTYNLKYYPGANNASVPDTEPAPRDGDQPQRERRRRVHE